MIEKPFKRVPHVISNGKMNHTIFRSTSPLLFIHQERHVIHEARSLHADLVSALAVTHSQVRGNGNEHIARKTPFYNCKCNSLLGLSTPLHIQDADWCSCLLRDQVMKRGPTWTKHSSSRQHGRARLRSLLPVVCRWRSTRRRRSLSVLSVSAVSL